MWRKLAATVTPLQRRKLAARQPDPAPPSGAGQAKPPAAKSTLSKPTPAPPSPETMSLAALFHAKQEAAATMPPGAGRRVSPTPPPPPPIAESKRGLDASWERKITKGVLEPDFSLDLHGAGLDAAYVRLMRGLTQAKSMGARVVLIVTGKPRPVEAADRGLARGAIRAKIGDWLAASEHAGDIAAVRGAHKRHGGQGALYVVLKRGR